MATSLLERIPLDDITVRARQARPGRAALTVIAAVLFGIGWFSYRALAGAWFVIAWCGAAVTEGWQSARRAGASS